MVTGQLQTQYECKQRKKEDGPSTTLFLPSKGKG